MGDSIEDNDRVAFVILGTGLELCSGGPANDVLSSAIAIDRWKANEWKYGWDIGECCLFKAKNLEV